MFSKTDIILLLVLLSAQISFSQVNKTGKDTVNMYQNIHKYSTKHKYTKFLHGLIFRSNSDKNEKIPQPIPHLNAEGKIIRNIKITTLDPFGYSDTDTTLMPKNWGERTGNRLHLKTKELAIRNYLLFKENSLYDVFKIKESERIIRAENFVNRITITERIVGAKLDSVDVYIRVLDSWSSVPRFSMSSTKIGIGLKERNFFGLGHQAEYKFTNRSTDGKNASDVTYIVPNFKNTFIKTTLKYAVDLDNYYDKSIAVERPFYSPLTEWAAGITVGQQFRKDTLQNATKQYVYQNFKHSSHDLWVGKAFHIIRGNYEGSNTTNLIISGRFLNIKYLESPTVALDSIDFYSSEKLVLTGVGVNTREFVQDRYIFKNGIIEDVPIGRIYGLTMGYQYKNESWHPYLGTQFSFGDYHDWGFLSTNFEIGTFFDHSKTVQTTLSFQANYFTNLIDIGKWKIRQFVKQQVVIGMNRQNSIGDRLNINENNGLQGFNSAVYGTNKMVLTLQTQSYAPKDIAGFRLNPYFSYSLGILRNKEIGINTTKAYSKIGVGVLINNDYLVFSSFQLSISYYPTIPFVGDNVFSTNAFETTDFGFQNFELAKPRTVLYK